MSHRKFLPSFPWARYSRKLVQKIERPRYVGSFSKEEAQVRQMRLAVGKEGTYAEGSLVALYWLVDESDGVIADAKFQVFGPSVLIGAAEAVCELLIRKNYDQALKMTADQIDKHLRDKPAVQAFASEHSGYLNVVLGAIVEAAACCEEIPLADHYVPTPVGGDPSQSNGPYPGWKALKLEQKLTVIEQVIAEDIRPYIELDAGGIRILSLVEDRELTIAYEGACTSCYSATGATLEAIQKILRGKVDPEIVVIPDSSFLQI
jgi:NifU-like protein